MGGQAHGRIGKCLQITDLIIECAFTDPADVQCANFYNILQVESFLQIGTTASASRVSISRGHPRQSDNNMPFSHLRRCQGEGFPG